VSGKQDRQELSEHFGVGLLVFSSAAISIWRVLASDLGTVGQIKMISESLEACAVGVWNKRQGVGLWSRLVSVRDVWLRRCIVEVRSEVTGPIVYCVMRREVWTHHLCDRKLHCVVLHSNPWVVTSQGNSREFVSWSECNRVQGGQTNTCGCSGRSLLFGYNLVILTI
jgi:hypothetical protein